ncbi:MAG: hypothetical protein FWH54_03770 [Methanobrevibacter sp.]|nr:hypothetical protein [Methanobrevibacter sp.]
MPISERDNDETKKKDKGGYNRSKIFAIIMILFVIGIASGAIIYTFTNPVNPVANPTHINNNTTTENITPKEGYSLISLGGLNFFVKNDCGEKFKNGDYFDSYLGGKNYHTDYEHQAPWEKGPINNSQIVTTKETNGSYESFWLEISNIGDSSIVDNLYYNNDEIRQDVSLEIMEIDGRNVTILHTSENFSSQSIGPNATIVCFEHGEKLIFMMWEGCPVDMYIVESFFKLN